VPDARSIPRTKVFISYSRLDMVFADKLAGALESRGLEVFIDRRVLPLLEEWQRELLGFIRRSDAIVFIVSDSSIRSEWCQWEVDQVIALSKRLAPIVLQRVPMERIPAALLEISLLFFDLPNAFDERVDQLAAALQTNIEWVHKHTRFGERARLWKEAGCPKTSHVLVGPELAEAESWLVSKPRVAPNPTELHLSFINASRDAQRAALEAERQQLARTKRLQRRWTFALAAIGFLLLFGAIAAFLQYDQSVRKEASVFTSLSSRALNETNYERAMRYALQALPPRGTLLFWHWPVNAEAKLAGSALLSRVERRLVGHAGPVLKVLFTPDGKQILTISTDRTARLWDRAGEQLLVFSGHQGFVSDAAFSPDGQRLATASIDKDAMVWDRLTGTQQLVLRGHEEILRSIAFNPDGSQLATASQDQTARIWDALSGEVLKVLKGHSGGVSTAQYSPDGKRLLTASDDKTGVIWDAATGKPLKSLLGHAGRVGAASFSNSGRFVVTASDDRTARIWDTETDAEPAVLSGHADRVTWAVFSPGDDLIVTTSADQTARLWDARSHNMLGVLSGHSGAVIRARFSADGKMLATVSTDKTARVWDVFERRELYALIGHEDEVVDIAFSPDGTRVVTASADGTARTWRLVPGVETNVLTGHQKEVWRAVFDPKDELIVSASEDGTVRLWGISSSASSRVLTRHEAEVSTAEFSPDGTKVVTASWDKTARIMDVSSGQQLFVLSGHNARVRAALGSAWSCGKFDTTSHLRLIDTYIVFPSGVT
jgi:WD40 repeat protein